MSPFYPLRFKSLRSMCIMANHSGLERFSEGYMYIRRMPLFVMFQICLPCVSNTTQSRVSYKNFLTVGGIQKRFPAIIFPRGWRWFYVSLRFLVTYSKTIQIFCEINWDSKLYFSASVAAYLWGKCFIPGSTVWRIYVIGSVKFFSLFLFHSVPVPVNCTRL